MRTNPAWLQSVGFFDCCAECPLHNAGVRTFAYGEAVNLEVHYYATTGTEKKLQPILDRTEFALLIAHWQSSKSTAAIALALDNLDTLYTYMRPLLVRLFVSQSSSPIDDHATLQQC